MTEIELTYTKTIKENVTEVIEVEFPIYIRRYYDLSVEYVKVNKDRTAIVIEAREPVVDDYGGFHNEKYSLTIIKEWNFNSGGGFDWTTGRGKRKSSERQFMEAVSKLGYYICEITGCDEG